MVLYSWAMVSGMMLISGLYMFISGCKHLLGALLSLEMMGLGLFSLMGMVFYEVGEGVMMMYFLVFLVGEGSLGLGLLVLMVRSYGSDFYSSMDLL